MANSTVEEQLASIEATLPHLATKADVERLMWRLGGLIVVCVGAGVAILRLWQ